MKKRDLNNRTYGYIKNKDRDDMKILKELMASKFNENQVKIIELLQEMNDTSDKIKKDVLELKRELKDMPDPIEFRTNKKIDIFKRPKPNE